MRSGPGLPYQPHLCPPFFPGHFWLFSHAPPSPWVCCCLLSQLFPSFFRPRFPWRLSLESCLPLCSHTTCKMSLCVYFIHLYLLKYLINYLAHHRCLVLKKIYFASLCSRKDLKCLIEIIANINEPLTCARHCSKCLTCFNSVNPRKSVMDEWACHVGTNIIPVLQVRK